MKTSHKLKKPIKIVEILPSDEEFFYGNCALTAIGNAFNISMPAIKTICFSLKISLNLDLFSHDSGLSFYECNRIINCICKANNYDVSYVPNWGKVTYNQMILLLNKGRYIVMFDIHLSCAIKGIIYDSYLKDNDDEDISKIIPTGWWEIRRL